MKRICNLALILSACFVSAAWGQQPAVSTNWSEFHRPNMQRWNPYEKVLGVKTVRNLRLKWNYATGKPVMSSPAVVNGVVYFGSTNHRVYSVNASTGTKLWSYLTGNHVWSSPAVVNGVVYFGSDDGNIYALNARTGAKLWSYATANSILYSSPAVANGVVYSASDDGNVYALNARTGTKLWSYLTATM